MPALVDPPATLEALPGPRLLAIGRLATELQVTTRALARLYREGAARTRLPDLRASLESLAGAKAAHLAVLDPFVEAVGRLAPQGPPAEPSPRPAGELDERGALFSRAFPAERALAVAYRELAALLPDPAIFPPLGILSAESAGHQARLRELYLRYS
jgi:hypothetical protein